MKKQTLWVAGKYFKTNMEWGRSGEYNEGKYTSALIKASVIYVSKYI